MRTRSRTFAAVQAGLAAAMLLAACGDGAGDRGMTNANEQGLATRERPVVAPSGEFTLELVADERDVADGTGAFERIRIRNREGDAVHESSARFSTRSAIEAVWDDHLDRVWVYSSDMGTYLWDRGGDGAWAARQLGPQGIADGTPAPPTLFVVRHPSVFGPQGRAKARKIVEQQRSATPAPADYDHDPRLKQ